jgi:hypothetical protein
MIAPPTSGKYIAFNLLLGGRGAEWLAEQREAGIAYRKIARQIHADYGLDVSGETVRYWGIQLGIDAVQAAS